MTGLNSTVALDPEEEAPFVCAFYNPDYIIYSGIEMGIVFERTKFFVKKRCLSKKTNDEIRNYCFLKTNKMGRSRTMNEENEKRRTCPSLLRDWFILHSMLRHDHSLLQNIQGNYSLKGLYA